MSRRATKSISPEDLGAAVVSLGAMVRKLVISDRKRERSIAQDDVRIMAVLRRLAALEAKILPPIQPHDVRVFAAAMTVRWGMTGPDERDRIGQ